MLLIFAAVGLCFFFLSSPNLEHQLQDAREALRAKKNSEALEIGEKILRREPKNPDALMLAAVASAELGQFAEAVTYCFRVEKDAQRQYVDSRCMVGNLLLDQLSLASQAELAFRQALEVDPDNVVALDRLGNILSLQTRTRELFPIQLRLIRSGSLSARTVVSLVQSDLIFPDINRIRDLRTVEPGHAGLKLSESRLPILSKDYKTAKTLVLEALKLDPTLIETHVRLGEILHEIGSSEELQEWRNELPEEALDHPGIWIVLGKLAARNRDTKTAIRCFWEAGSRDAAMLSANYMLGHQLAALGRIDESKPFLVRATELEKYRRLFEFENAPTLGLSLGVLKTGSELAESLGLIWEAYGFASLAIQNDSNTQWARKTVGRLQIQIGHLPLQRTIQTADIFKEIDLTDYPLPEIGDGNEIRLVQTVDKTVSSVRFESVAKKLGIQFQFDNGVDHRISGTQRPYDFTGGGIAAIDFDSDGWPDLFFSQGCTLDNTTGKPTRGHFDQLNRNLSGEEFENTSDHSLPSDLDYSQGVSAGDFNNDGFPDLFVANLGLNRLLLNNGDGTFSDASNSIEHDTASWTVSCLICDINGDQWPDLYSVNYLSGDIVSRLCRDENGQVNSCAPQNFAPSQDQIHLNDGTGRFIDVTQTSGIRVPNGKGLGIVAADLNGDQQIDLFIANDAVPNFLFENNTNAGELSFTEVAVVRGVAVNGDGISEGCMGVIVEDLDRDLDLDFLVTNFLEETNTLYSSSDNSGFFEDKTWSTGLGAPSHSVLGFGIQALDGELDGFPDILLVNGHVDDFSKRGVPYQMAPQFFCNIGGLRFSQAVPSTLGNFFSEKSLGRCVTRIDWDRDGMEEVAISHLDVPNSLLHNTTSPRGHSLTLNLRATASQRDAIGAIVTIISPDGKTIQRQLSAGDGFQASNQRTLVFGFGEQSDPVEVKILWLNGTIESFTNIAIDREYIAIEGQDVLYQLFSI